MSDSWAARLFVETGGLTDQQFGAHIIARIDELLSEPGVMPERRIWLRRKRRQVEAVLRKLGDGS